MDKREGFICRLCGEKWENFELFDGVISPGLAQKIRKYLRVQVQPRDGLPQKVCEHCKARVLAFHSYARQVHSTQFQLITEMTKRKSSVEDGDGKPPEAKPVSKPEKATSSILHSILTNPTPSKVKKPSSSGPPALVPLLIKFSRTGTPTISSISTVHSQKPCTVTSNLKTFALISKSKSLPSSVGDKHTAATIVSSVKDLRAATLRSQTSSTELSSALKDPSQSVQLLSGEDVTDPLAPAKEEPDDSYSDVHIKEEPMDAVEEDPSPSLEDEMVQVKEEMEEARDEEDLEVTLDPMEFLLREDTSSSGSAKQTDDLEPDEINHDSSSNATTSGQTSGKLKIKSFSQLKRNPLRQHPVFMDKRSEPKPYQCAICPRGYFSDIGLQNHLWSHRKILKNSDVTNLTSKGNEQTPSLKKSAPSSQFTNITASNLLSYNNAMFCKEATKYQCPLCKKKINTRANLRRHLQAHKATGSYTCEICSRVFKTKINLSRHLLCHNAEELSCPVCNRVYPTNSTLRAHMISHSNDRPHSCPFCEKTFKRNQDLKFHLNQHTGERPYKCPFCEKTFASSGNCFSHRKRMHLGESLPATSGEEDKDTEEAGE